MGFTKMRNADGTTQLLDAPTVACRRTLRLRNTRSIMRSPCRQDDTGTVVLDEQVRLRKVRDIRRQLRQGRYDVLGRLDAVADRLLEVLTR